MLECYKSGSRIRCLFDPCTGIRDRKNSDPGKTTRIRNTAMLPQPAVQTAWRLHHRRISVPTIKEGRQPPLLLSYYFGLRITLTLMRIRLRCFTLMRIRIWLFTLIRIRIGIWLFVMRIRILMRICNIGQHTLLSYCEPCMAPGYRMPLRFHCEPPQLRLLNLIWLLTLMWIRIRRFHLMRTRIRPLKIMPVHADPDPQHWVHPWPRAS